MKSIVRESLLVSRILRKSLICHGVSKFSTTTLLSTGDDNQINFAEGILKNVDQFEGRTALIDGKTGASLKYSELYQQAHLLASNLRSRGIRRGQTISICSENSAQPIVAMLGVILAGGTAHFINHLATQEEIERQLSQTQSRYVICGQHPLENIVNATKQICKLEEIFICDNTLSYVSENERCSSVRNLLSDCGSTHRLPPPDSQVNDICLYMSSSGTTGTPKLTRLSHRSMLRNLLSSVNVFGLQEHGTSLLTVPFSHMYGLQCALSPILLTGGTVVLLPRYNLQDFLETIEKYRVTKVPLVPTIIMDMLNSDITDNYDISSLTDIMTSGYRIHEPTEQAIRSLLKVRAKNCDFRACHGMTELSGACLCVPYAKDRNCIPSAGSVGPAVVGTEVKLMRPTSTSLFEMHSATSGFEEVGQGEYGELWFRGPSNCMGYLNNETQDKELFYDGWIRSGDIAYQEKNGYYKVVDRIKNMIKYKGHQVSPEEVEEVLMRHPSVADCGVVGKPDEAVGEVPMAFVVRKCDVEPHELVDHVASLLSPVKHIRGGVVFVDSIPKLPSGKKLRRKLLTL